MATHAIDPKKKDATSDTLFYILAGCIALTFVVSLGYVVYSFFV